MKNQKKARYYYTYMVRKTKSIAMLLIPWPATADAASARRLDQCVTCANPLEKTFIRAIKNGATMTSSLSSATSSAERVY